MNDGIRDETVKNYFSISENMHMSKIKALRFINKIDNDKMDYLIKTGLFKTKQAPMEPVEVRFIKPEWMKPEANSKIVDKSDENKEI